MQSVVSISDMPSAIQMQVSPNTIGRKMKQGTRKKRRTEDIVADESKHSHRTFSHKGRQPDCALIAYVSDGIEQRATRP